MKFVALWDDSGISKKRLFRDAEIQLLSFAENDQSASPCFFYMM
jgi:hypothetical protein